MPRNAASSLDAALIARFALRVLAVVVPPLLVAGALLAAPKGPPAPPKKPPAGSATPKPKWTPKPKATAKDADVENGEGGAASDAPKEKEFKSDAKAGPTKTDDNPYGPEVKESEHKEGDATVKEFKFGETQIEGRSRWPAVTYFIRRMRAEFEAQKLPHRSFLPELSASKGDPAVK
jgi:hypothetical protein